LIIGILEFGLNFRCPGHGVKGRGRPADHSAVHTHKEGLPVPRDVRGLDRRVHQVGVVESFRGGWAVALEILVEWSLYGSIDVNLGEHLEVGDKAPSRTHVLDAVKDLDLCTRFLIMELSAGETQDDEGVITIFGLECIHTMVMGGEPSVGGDIYHQDHLASVVTEGDVLGSGDVQHGEVVDAALVIAWLLTRHHAGRSSINNGK